MDSQAPRHIEYDGDIYQWSEGYYKTRKGKKNKKAKFPTLHQAVWSSVHGKLPKGYCIHHKDENPMNNDIDNLELLSIQAHNAHHAKTNIWIHSNECKDHLRKVRLLSLNWHSTPEGKKYHADHIREIWKNHEWFEKPCQECGKIFRSQKPFAKSCSHYCSFKHRKKFGRHFKSHFPSGRGELGRLG